MKKILMVVVLLNLFCVNGNVLDQIPRFETREEAMYWVYSNIVWTMREDIYAWQSPELTLRLKTGVCIDQSILLMYIFKNQFNDNPKIWIIHKNPNPLLNHAIVYSNNKLYIPSRRKIEYNYLYDIDYDTAMFVSSFNK